MSDMSEFDEALARSVEEGIARGGLPGAADAVRRGRRRSLRARGGVTVLGVAVVAGALGGAGILGGGAGSVAAGSATGAHADEGFMPAAQWPGYDLEHWKLKPSGCSLADRSKCVPGDAIDHVVTEVKVADWAGGCYPGPSFPVRRYAVYATNYDEGRKLGAYETVVTFRDENAAAAYLAGARAVAVKTNCADTAESATVTLPGASTGDGVSWVSEEQRPTAGYRHNYVVQVDDRVALLSVDQMSGDTLQSTAGDATVLQNLADALAR
jgi:hypothetical protein